MDSKFGEICDLVQHWFQFNIQMSFHLVLLRVHAESFHLHMPGSPGIMARSLRVELPSVSFHNLLCSSDWASLTQTFRIFLSLPDPLIISYLARRNNTCSRRKFHQVQTNRKVDQCLHFGVVLSKRSRLWYFPRHKLRYKLTYMVEDLQ